MADCRHGCAAANGFRPHNLTIDEAWALYNNTYPMPPDMRLPGHWKLGAGGIGIPLVPTPNSMRLISEVHAHDTSQTYL
jgi:hypothetical protein